MLLQEIAASLINLSFSRSDESEEMKHPSTTYAIPTMEQTERRVSLPKWMDLNSPVHEYPPVLKRA